MNHLKKTVAIVLAATSVSAYTVLADASGKGDVDGNGAIDSSDAFLALNASIYPDYLTDDEYNRADYNGDGTVDSTDALMILRASVGKEDEEPVPTVAAPQPAPVQKTYTQVSEMEGWSPAQVVAKVGPLFTEDQRKTGILASVSLAQFIIESGYGQSLLSLEANNCFGIKGYPGYYDEDAPWDGVSVYTISTKEYDAYGNSYYYDAMFRYYDCMEDSIEDHSLVLINTSWDGVTPVYQGIVGCTDYRQAAQIIYNGGYATSPTYVQTICDVIEYWDLTQYDLANAPASYEQTYTTPVTQEQPKVKLYRVRTSWSDPDSQLGAFQYLENAVECARLNPGYKIYDEDGNIVY